MKADSARPTANASGIAQSCKDALPTSNVTVDAGALDINLAKILEGKGGASLGKTVVSVLADSSVAKNEPYKDCLRSGLQEKILAKYSATTTVQASADLCILYALQPGIESKAAIQCTALVSDCTNTKCMPILRTQIAAGDASTFSLALTQFNTCLESQAKEQADCVSREKAALRIDEEFSVGEHGCTTDSTSISGKPDKCEAPFIYTAPPGTVIVHHEYSVSQERGSCRPSVALDPSGTSVKWILEGKSPPGVTNAGERGKCYVKARVRLAERLVGGILDKCKKQGTAGCA